MKKIFVVTAIFLGIVTGQLLPSNVYAQVAPESLPGVVITPFFSVEVNAGYTGKSKEQSATGEKEQDSEFTLTDVVAGFSFEKQALRGEFNIGLGDDEVAEIQTAYAIYSFNSFEFMLGHDYAPYTFYSNEASFEHAGLAGFGTTTEDDRLLQAKILYKGFYVGIIETHEPGDDDGNYEIAGTDVLDYETVFPKTVLGYAYEGESVQFGLGAAMQRIKVNDPTISWIDGEVVTSYLGFVHSSVEFAGFTLLANFGYAVNPYEFGLAHEVKTTLMQDGTDLENTTTVEGFVELGYNAGLAIVRLGAGYVQSDNDAYAEKDTALAYYLQTEIPVNEHLTITPEFSLHDARNDADDVDEGYQYNAGILMVMGF